MSQKNSFSNLQLYVSKLIINKVSDGDLTAGIKIMTSTETIAPFDDRNVSELRAKHPTNISNSNSLYTMCVNDMSLQVPKKGSFSLRVEWMFYDPHTCFTKNFWI